MYYLRLVLHDWQDKDATRILKGIKPAMGRDGRIMISETAMPEPVTPRDAGAVWMDLMMLSIGGKGRTARDWAKLAELSGLKLVGFGRSRGSLGLFVLLNICFQKNHKHSGVNGSRRPHADRPSRKQPPLSTEIFEALVAEKAV